MTQKPRFLKKRYILLGLFIYLLIFVSNFSGVCHEKGRRLTDQEILTKVGGDVYQNEPNCCQIGEKSFYVPLSSFEEFINKFFGTYYYYVVVNKIEDPSNKQYSYAHTEEYYVDACAKEYNYKTGEGLRKEDYEYNINSIKLDNKPRS